MIGIQINDLPGHGYDKYASHRCPIRENGHCWAPFAAGLRRIKGEIVPVLTWIFSMLVYGE
jgi:hypothetical protein